jgi:hypothetical protein
LAAGLAMLALVAVIALRGAGQDSERSAPVPARPPALQILGTYERVGADAGGIKLWIQGSSLRLLVPGDAVPSQFVGFVTISGDVLTVRVDLDRISGNEWPDAGCRGATRTALGRYRFQVRRGRLSFSVLDDPCRGRAQLLTRYVWRRSG